MNHVVNGNLMSKGGVDGKNIGLLHAEENILILDVGCNPLHFNVEALDFLTGVNDVVMGIKSKTACRSSPLALSDILSCVTEEIEV